MADRVDITPVSAHPGVSNERPNAPLESCIRAHRTLTSARGSRSDLTERPGAPKARALAKLRYSPWRNYSSASAPLLRPPMPIPAVPIAQSARGPAGRPPLRHHLAAFDDARLSRSSASPPRPRYETRWPRYPSRGKNRTTAADSDQARPGAVARRGRARPRRSSLLQRVLHRAPAPGRTAPRLGVFECHLIHAGPLRAQDSVVGRGAWHVGM